jgi:SAM-dependent methyltransferase
VKQKTRERLLQINREFYQSFAQPFSQSRKRLQPGVLRALEQLLPASQVLDLGCGNGELSHYLFESGHEGKYVGVDASEELLMEAESAVAASQAIFLYLDLADKVWVEQLAALMSTKPQFDTIFAFAVIHHLPSHDLRLNLLQSAHDLLSQGGTMMLSVWNFLASPRLSKRIVPWSAVKLAEQELEEGDFLLDWRSGGYGLRYVHHFTGPELRDLAHKAGYEVLDEFLSDGEGGNLGRYQIWRTML